MMVANDSRTTTQAANSMVVNHLPKSLGNFGWNVNGKAIVVFLTGKLPKFSQRLER